MALRANEHEDNSSRNAPIPGLSYFWQETEKQPEGDWAQWIELFQLAVLARHSISVEEITREEEQNNPRNAALMGGMTRDMAQRKVVSLLYLSIGKVGRKMLMDKYPNINIFTVELGGILNNCRDCFETRRNRTLDRHAFFSRKQKENESLQQFWNVLNGLASKCDFGNQSESLVYDIFILNMINKQVQEKLCTEPKDTPREALQFAVVFEEGLKRQKTIGQPSTSIKLKEEPVYAINKKPNDRESWRCGKGNFTSAHLNSCKGPETICNYCGLKGHFERCCNAKQKNKIGKNAIGRRNDKRFGFAKRVQMVDQDESDTYENTMVLKIDDETEKESAKPFYMEGFINRQPFKTMIDTGSPVTIFAVDEIKKIMKRDQLQVRRMVDDEKYVDFNGKPLNILGYVFCELQVGNQYVARQGVKSMIGREWLSTLKLEIAPKSQDKGECIVNSIEKEECEKLSDETKMFVKEFPELFSRKGKIKNHKVKITIKDEAKITQQKGRRVPIQLQKSVDAEIKRLLAEGHIEKIDKISDNVFIQSTVITVKKADQ